MDKPFTGRHMAAIFVAGFGVVIAVNLLLAREAVATFGGLVVENSYVASQHFNGWLEQAKRDKALGWNVDLARQPDGRMMVTTRGVPDDARVKGDAWHPLGRMPDQALRFEPVGTGRYVSTTSLPAGRWLVRLELSSGANRWRGERTLQ